MHEVDELCFLAPVGNDAELHAANRVNKQRTVLVFFFLFSCFRLQFQHFVVESGNIMRRVQVRTLHQAQRE